MALFLRPHPTHPLLLCFWPLRFQVSDGILKKTHTWNWFVIFFFCAWTHHHLNFYFNFIFPPLKQLEKLSFLSCDGSKWLPPTGYNNTNAALKSKEKKNEGRVNFGQIRCDGIHLKKNCLKKKITIGMLFCYSIRHWLLRIVHSYKV